MKICFTLKLFSLHIQFHYPIFYQQQTELAQSFKSDMSTVVDSTALHAPGFLLQWQVI